VGLQVRDRAETRKLVERLRRHRLKTLDFSENELAKLHVRYTVGGHAPTVDNEILYRFEFPERPGALMKFLSAMSRGWNISLFHYRNHGADYGRVLVGMQVPPRDARRFRAFLAKVGYPWQEETRNPAYQRAASTGALAARFTAYGGVGKPARMKPIDRGFRAVHYNAESGRTAACGGGRAGRRPG